MFSEWATRAKIVPELPVLGAFNSRMPSSRYSQLNHSEPVSCGESNVPHSTKSKLN